ncbi:MAG: hypothetical protein Q9168_005390 [Polycauliona sp. 1 TL-2023]
MDDSVRQGYGQCVRAFETLCTALAREQEQWSEELVPEVVDDLFGRFNVWAGNIGAGQRGQASLDYRLREASSIKEHIVGTLRSLFESLGDATSIVSGSRLPYDQLSSDSDSSSSSLSTTSGQDHLDLQLSAEHPSAEDCARTELQQLHHSVDTFVSNLYKVSILIRQSQIPHDRTTKAARIDTSFYHRYDHGHVQEKYRGANAALVKRLANANTRRRKYFKYREQHRQRLSRRDATKQPAPVGLPIQQSRVEPDQEVLQREQQSAPSVVQTASVVQPSTMVQSTKASTFHAPDVSAVDLDLNDQQSVTETWTTSGSVSSTKQEKLALPSIPGSALGGREFECPYCYTICCLKSSDDYRRKKEWKRHVLRDLQPYICTFGNCSQADTMFERRRDWFGHELQVHRVEWCCNTPGHQAYAVRSEFRTHLEGHGESYDDGELDSVIDIFKRSAVEAVFSCPICGAYRAQSLGVDKFEAHLGRHLEMASTFALPSSGIVDGSSDSLVTNDAVQNDYVDTETTGSTHSHSIMDHGRKSNVNSSPDDGESVEEVQEVQHSYMRDLHTFLEETRHGAESLNCTIGDLFHGLEWSTSSARKVMCESLSKLRSSSSGGPEAETDNAIVEDSIRTRMLLRFVEYARNVIVDEMLVPESDPGFHTMMRSSLQLLTDRIVYCSMVDPLRQTSLEAQQVQQSLQRLNCKLLGPDAVDEFDQGLTQSDTGAPEFDEDWNFIQEDGGSGLQTSLNPVQGNTGTNNKLGDIRKWFEDLSKILAQIAAQRFSGTAEWIFVYPSYIDLKQGLRRFLLLEGLRHSSIIENLRRCSAICAFYFFRPPADELSIEHVIELLIYQLVDQVHDIPAELVDPVTEKLGGAGTLDLEELLDVLQTTFTFFREIYIVLDGLDQCSKHAARTISRIIQKSIKMDTHARILATSRFDLNLEDAIEKEQFERPSYTRPKLQWHRNTKIEVIPREVIQDDIIKVIKSSQYSQHAEYIASESKGIGIPPSIDDLWNVMLDSIVNALGVVEDQAAASEVLGLVCVSQRSLEAGEIHDYLSYDRSRSSWGKYRYSDEYAMWRRYPSLLQFIGQPGKPNKPDRYIYHLGLIHPSLKDWLRPKVGQSPEDPHEWFVVDPLKAQEEVAIRCVSYLLRYKSPSSYTSKSGWTAYAGTYWHQHVKKLGSLANEGLTANCIELLDQRTPSFSHWTYMTRRDGDIDNSEGGDFGKQNTHPSPLYYAALLGLHQCALKLIENGADVNTRGGKHEYPVIAAVAAGEEELVEVLAPHLNMSDGVSDAPGLNDAALKAVELGRISMLQKLLELGGNFSQKDERGWAIVHRAIEYDRPDCLQILTIFGADLYSRDNAGMTPLHLASSIGAIACVEYLLTINADIEATTDNHSRSPLLVAAARGQNEALALLLEEEAKVDSLDAWGMTALCYASARLNLPMVTSLLEAGASVNPLTDVGTPLHMVVASNKGLEAMFAMDGNELSTREHNLPDQIAIVKRLLEYGADPLIRDEKGRLPEDIVSDPELRELLRRPESVGFTVNEPHVSRRSRVPATPRLRGRGPGGSSKEDIFEPN